MGTVLLLVLAVAGCSGGDGGGQRSITDIVREAIEQAKDRRDDTSGDAPRPADPQPSIGTDARTSFDYAAYERTISAVLGLLEQYWSQTLPTLGAAYSSPKGYTYYRSDQGGGPACGPEPAPANNAFYCPVGDFIAWDESGLMIPYYVGGGDFAAAFVLAHEFGHAMQARLPKQEQLGVLRELQADCFAGAWAAWVAERDLINAGDLDEATLAVFIARDIPGTPWTDPAAHGTGFERTRAFGDGFASGAKVCYPAPGEQWIIPQR
ncbi:protein of unknown function zinc metallopeptidase [Micromonospora aurantiaca ATCC 27029]|nr:protein of unknown function zinc metallopeptidase [Micromonospora aurantiaca ATCC 27029]